MGLTPRELEVVRLVYLECPNKAIALLLGTSIDTVEQQVYSAKCKLGVTSRIGLALWYQRRILLVH